MKEEDIRYTPQRGENATEKPSESEYCVFEVRIAIVRTQHTHTHVFPQQIKLRGEEREKDVQLGRNSITYVYLLY